MSSIEERAQKIRERRKAHWHYPDGSPPAGNGAPAPAYSDYTVCTDLHTTNPIETALDALALAWDVLPESPSALRWGVKNAYLGILATVEQV